MNLGQKFLLFLLVFAGTAGVLKVDAAYGDMMDQDGILALTLRRVDEENIRVSLLGRSQLVNMDELETEVTELWEETQQTVTAALEQVASSARKLCGVDDSENQLDEELKSVVFPTQTL